MFTEDLEGKYLTRKSFPFALPSQKVALFYCSYMCKCICFIYVLYVIQILSYELFMTYKYV